MDPTTFSFTSGPIDAATQQRMQGVSIRPGCPVPFDRLRLVHVSHWDFDGNLVTGELVVNAESVDAMRTVFAALHRDRFPIRRMQLVDDYGAAAKASDGADDFKSIEADNTSAFNCRTRTGSSSKDWSQHSFGTAIDINPIENPYVETSGRTSHPASVPFLKRSIVRPGMAVAGGPLVRAFENVGWRWGGTWSGPIDFQHFSLNGR